MVNSSTQEKEAFLFHAAALFILSLYYLIPYFLTGHLITRPMDLLEKEIVCDYILGRFYRGDFEALNLMLAGEVKWYMMWRVFQPLSLLYALFDTEFAFWTKDIIIKIASYSFFFKLSRKLNCKVFNSTLIACLFTSSSMVHYGFGGGSELGLGIAALPYLIYLMLKNKPLKLKHYLAIIFIGLNTDLVRHLSIIPVMFLTSFILFPKNKKYNFRLFFKISILLLFFIFLSSSNLIYTHIFLGPFHRIGFLVTPMDLMANFNNLVFNFFEIPSMKNSPYFFQNLPLSFYVLPVLLIGLLSKNRISYLLLLIIFLIHFIEFISQTEFVTTIRNNSEGLIKTLNWNTMLTTTLPVLFGLIFVNITKLEIIKFTKYLIYPLLFLSLLTFQIRIASVPLAKHFLSFDSLSIEKKNKLEQNFYNRKYNLLIKEMVQINKNKAINLKKQFKSKYTFEGYYDYKNYKYIKSLVGNSKTISISLDPMVAVMNDIYVLGGYYNIYPMNYKLKFRKVIEKQLEHYSQYKNYFDKYGHRVNTFVINPDIIKIDFSQANILGAEYVISKYPISDKVLESICLQCNGSSELYLYKIKI